MRFDKTRIDLLLAEKTMSKADLSRKSGILPQNISAILSRGTCEPKTLGRIASALEVDVSQLIVREV